MTDITPVRIPMVTTEEAGLNGASPEEGTGLSASPEPKVSALPGFDPSRWQPIETALRDGTELLLFAPSGIYVGYWFDGALDGPNWCEHQEGLPVEYVTHWMPLPAPPASATEAQRAETGTGSVHECAARRETPVPLPSAGANEREVAAVAKAIEAGGYAWLDEHPNRREMGWADVPNEPLARAAIKALDEHRAAEAPNRKD